MQKYSLKIISIFSTGALTYGSIEIMSRGFTHISMGILGGITMLFISYLNFLRRNDQMTLLPQMFLITLFITSSELCTGLVVNKCMNMRIWDYSHIPMNLDGQICLPFSIIWFVLSFFGILLEDFLNWKIFRESKPNYNISKATNEI